MSAELEALRLRVDRVELEVRLLDALIRIRRADAELRRARIRNEESIGIHRFAEPTYAGAASPGA